MCSLVFMWVNLGTLACLKSLGKLDIIYPEYVTNIPGLSELEEASDTSSSLTWVVGTLFCLCWGGGRSLHKRGNVGTLFKRVKGFELAGI